MLSYGLLYSHGNDLYRVTYTGYFPSSPPRGLAQVYGICSEQNPMKLILWNVKFGNYTAAHNQAFFVAKSLECCWVASVHSYMYELQSC